MFSSVTVPSLESSLPCDVSLEEWRMVLYHTHAPSLPPSSHPFPSVPFPSEMSSRPSALSCSMSCHHSTAVYSPGLVLLCLFISHLWSNIFTTTRSFTFKRHSLLQQMSICIYFPAVATKFLYSYKISAFFFLPGTKFLEFPVCVFTFRDSVHLV